MRYFNVDDVSFTDVNGRSINIKDVLPIPDRAVASFKIKCNKNISLDEVITRPEVLGEGMEAEAYRVFDENVVEIFEARFDMGKISTLRVPI